MSDLAELLIGIACLLLLFMIGRVFLEHSVYRDYEDRNLSVQLLFSAVFALSANMLQLLLFEILDIFTPRSVLPSDLF